MIGAIDTNTLTTIITAIGAAVITFAVARFGKSWDARGQAEAALMGIGPAIIQEQNKRIGNLTEQIEALWKRDRECREELADGNRRLRLLEASAQSRT